MKRKIFISHIAEEKDIALSLKSFLTKNYLGLFDVFVSSDSNSLELGENWLNVVLDSIKNCDLMFVLCSPISVNRPWIAFEAGAGWSKQIPVIPVCHSGISPGELPLPLRTLQGCVLGSHDSVQKILERISKIFEIQVPDVNTNSFLSSISNFETCQKDSKIKRDYCFVWNYLNRKIMVLKHSIFESCVDTIDQNGLNYNEFVDAGHYDYHKVYNSFNYSHYNHSKGIKVYEELYLTIMSLCEDIRFLLMYPNIELSAETTIRLERFLFMRVLSERWYDDMVFIDHMICCSDIEICKRTKEEIINETIPLEKRKDSNIFNSLIDYYDSLLKYRDEINSIEENIYNTLESIKGKYS